MQQIFRANWIPETFSEKSPPQRMGVKIISGDTERWKSGTSVTRGLQKSSSLTNRTATHGLYWDFALFQNIKPSSTFINPEKNKKSEICGQLFRNQNQYQTFINPQKNKKVDICEQLWGKSLNKSRQTFHKGSTLGIWNVISRIQHLKWKWKR